MASQMASRGLQGTKELPKTPERASQIVPTFTTALSIPVIGTRPIVSNPSSSSPGPSGNLHSSSTQSHLGSSAQAHNGPSVVPAGPAPARMSMSRMSGTGISNNNNNTNGSSSKRQSAVHEESAREGDRPPDLGIQPITVPSVLDLNSVRTRVPTPRPPPPPASAFPGPGNEGARPGPSTNGAEAATASSRPFELEDCPVFYPTQEEWNDPMAFVRKITPKAEKFGLCKIVPPEDWKMPFVTDTETFRFKTRLQRLNQVEASSRAKINFLEQLYRYHKQNNGMRVVVPTINHHTLDLWLLRKEVQKLGGCTTVTTQNKWGDVGRTLGYTSIPNVGLQLHQAYVKIIEPYEAFLVHVKNSPALTPGANLNGKTGVATSAPESPTISRMTSIGSRGAPMTTVDLVLERQAKMGNGVAGDENRMARTRGDTESQDAHMSDLFKTNGSDKPKSRMGAITPVLKDDHGDYCEICKKKEKPSEMLLCDGCDGGYHIYCLDPPLSGVPKGQWFCHSCLDGSNNDFGFEEGEEHTLTTFQARDLAFRKLWFESHPPASATADDTAMVVDGDQPDADMITRIGNLKISEYDVEKEFWRLVQSSEDTVEVEYGADVHSTTHGSAMPTIETHPLDPYSREPWNLNNLPIISDSLLRFIKTDISGMTVPWTYVGMIFSTFCWHNEDHYTYSVNYMHWGASKTWYGVPGGDADKFEAAIRSEAPELFDAQPDLLYQLVTLMRPDRLKQAGVRVVACNQRPGEFVVTFPKAYHAGFNHGFNFNEAINFALPEWLTLGLQSVMRYKEHHKAPVFSHDELLCTITQHSTSIKTAIWLKEHLIEMRKREAASRDRVRNDFPGITEIIDESEGNEEDQLQCLVCKSFCYLSRVTCECTSSVVCHTHADSLCDCPSFKRILQLRYTDTDLDDIVDAALARAAQPFTWRSKLAQLLIESPRPLFRSLKNLAAEGDKINYPLPELANLKRCIERGELWMAHAALMLKQKKEPRRKKRVKKEASTPIPEENEGVERTMAEAQALMAKVSLLGFDAPEIGVLGSVIEQAKDFKTRATALLDRVKSEPGCWQDATLRAEMSTECQELVKIGWSVNLSLEETDQLNLLAKKFELLERLDGVQRDLLTLSEVRLHLEHARACGLSNEHPLLDVLRGKEVIGEEWEKRANVIFESKVKNLRDMDEFTELPHGHPIDASVLAKIMAIRARAKELEKQAKALMFPEGMKRTKIADAQRLIIRAEKDFNIPSVVELKRVLDFAMDLEQRCEAVLNKRHPQSESESVFDAVRKWRAYADEHLVMKFHLPQYEMLKNQLDQHDKWYNRLPFPKPRRDHVELLYKDVAESTKTEEDAAPAEEFCTCICTLPVRPPPPGTISDAVQCDHCHARFHPQCAGGSCPFCDHHHWNGSLHRSRYYHSFDVLACVRPVPDLTRNYSRLWKQIEFIATRIARLQNVITHFLAFAAQTQNQRPEIIPQVRHYMRKLFKIQLAISPKPNVSYGLDLAGLHRILAGQKKSQKRRKRAKVMLRQENEKVAPDGTQCFCHGQAPIYEGVLLVKCGNCHKMFHGGCLFWGNGPPPPEDWQCPICVTKRGKPYRGAEIRVKSPDDHEFGVFVDVKRTIEGNRDLVKVQMGEANGPCITLDLLAFYPAEDTQSQMPPPLPGVPMGMAPTLNMAYPAPPFFGPPGQFPHMMLSHPMSGQPHRVMVPSTAAQINPTQIHGSHPHSSLPPPPMTTAYPGNWSNDIPGLDKKKRKRSVETKPDDPKRRKSEFSTPVSTPLNGAGVIPGTPVEDLDVIDLTFDEAMPMSASPAAGPSYSSRSAVDPTLTQKDEDMSKAD